MAGYIKGETFRRGDIVRNVWAGDGNPYQYVMYLGKSTIRQGRYCHKVYEAIGYDGKKIHLFTDGREPGEPSIVKVGHMEEYDKFMSALKQLKDMRGGDTDA